MNWSQWKMGLLIAALTGLMNGLIGLGVDMTPKQIAILLLVNFGKDVLLYLKTNAPAAKAPLWLIATLLPAALLAGCANYKAAGVITVTAERAMQSYANYYDAAIANPAAFGTTQAKLWKQRIEVDNAYEAYRLAMNTADDTRLAGGDVKAALQVANARSGQFVTLVFQFLPEQFKPK